MLKTFTSKFEFMQIIEIKKHASHFISDQRHKLTKKKTTKISQFAAIIIELQIKG